MVWAILAAVLVGRIRAAWREIGEDWIGMLVDEGLSLSRETDEGDTRPENPAQRL